MEFISNNEKDTAKIAKSFVKDLKPNGGRAAVVGLYGELGSGKTTFMKYVAEALGVKETIQSPTFVIMKRFNIPALSSKLLALSFSNLIHIDAYRIEKDTEMINLRWNEIVADPGNLIFIEWPERIERLMPPHIMVRFEHGQREGERKISTS